MFNFCEIWCVHGGAFGIVSVTLLSVPTTTQTPFTLLQPSLNGIMKSETGGASMVNPLSWLPFCEL